MSRKDEKQRFRDAWILSGAALAGKGIGAVYRIPLTRILGAQGMGLYQAVYPLYALLVTFATGGLGAAVAKAAAEDGKFPVMRAVGVTFAVTVPLGLLGAALCRLLSAAAGVGEAWLALLLLCVSVPLSGVTAVFRGYFQGRGNAIPSAAGQLCEQGVKLVAGLALSAFLMRFSLFWGIAGTALGVGIAEGVTSLFTLLYYAAHRRKPTERPPALDQPIPDPTPAVVQNTAVMGETAAEIFPSAALPKQEKTRGGLFKKLYAVALPVTAGLAVLPLCGAFDSFTVVNLLVRGGLARARATALYGLIAGPVSALINLPAVFTLGLAGMLLPRVSKLIKTDGRVSPPIKRAAAVALGIGIVCGGGLFLFAPLFLSVVYGAGLPAGSVSLLRVCALSVPFLSVLQIASASLQGMGKAIVPFFSLLGAAAVKEVLNVLLLPRIGALGFAVSTVAFYALACLADVLCLLFLLRAKEKAPSQTVAFL